MKQYDLIIIGSGPAGERAAIQAAKLERSVLVIEQDAAPGGSCTHRGTIPSKTLRESVQYLLHLRERSLYGVSVHMDEPLTINRLMHRKNAAVASLVERLQHNIQRNHINYLQGQARFEDPYTISVLLPDGNKEYFKSHYFLIATGSRPWRPPLLDFNHPCICDSDTILELSKIPKTLTIFGAGVIGCEYATIFSHLDVKVNLVNPRQLLLDFLDWEISNSLAYLMRESGVRLRFGEELQQVTTDKDHVYLHTHTRKVIKSDCLLMANGRTGNTENLGLDRLKLKVNQRQQIPVNACFQTQIPHIYAAGDVIGFPSLAATAMDQGRFATLHAFEATTEPLDTSLMPTGIYTIPEISTVGATEKELSEKNIPYEVGIANFREIAKCQISGHTTGKLKLLFHNSSHQLLGVHAIGDHASDLIHIGQAVMVFKGTIHYFLTHTLNYPTFSECYRVAAFNGLNRL